MLFYDRKIVLHGCWVRESLNKWIIPYCFMVPTMLFEIAVRYPLFFPCFWNGGCSSLSIFCSFGLALFFEGKLFLNGFTTSFTFKNNRNIIIIEKARCHNGNTKAGGWGVRGGTLNLKWRGWLQDFQGLQIFHSAIIS